MTNKEPNVNSERGLARSRASLSRTEFRSEPINPTFSAAEFLRQPEERHKKEGNVQSDLEALLRDIGVGTLESHYSIGEVGEADIYLPNRRTIIEVKAYPLAANPDKPQQGRSSESPRAQLDRYVIGEINREVNRVQFDDDDYIHGTWLGILTDGKNWHVYEYPHKFHSKGRLYCKHLYFASDGESLAKLLYSLLGDREFGKKWIPSNPGNLFTKLNEELDVLYRELPNYVLTSTETKWQLWYDMVRTSGMVPDDEQGKNRLFVTHCFLISVVRFVSHTLFPVSDNSNWSSALKDSFASWILEFSRGKSWARRLYDLIAEFDWSRREEDVLKSLYHHFVDSKDRKVFGEYYTPDWLAALMVEEVLDDKWVDDSIEAAANAIHSGVKLEGVGVLDPTCGSGTFLLHAALRLLSAEKMQRFQKVQKADIVTQLINGMDVHPVAVELARVNLERILPAPPSKGSSAFRIHQGDSLAAEIGMQIQLFGHTKKHMRLSTPRGREVFLPMSFVRRDSFPENMRQMVDAATDGRALPDYLTGSLNPEESSDLVECHRILGDIIREEGNSVWTWYTINLVAPHLLSRCKIDRVVANPPWVKLADIQVKSRRQSMEDFRDALNLRGEGKQAPHSDIASYFVLGVRERYMANPESDPASWLVKKSAIRSGQWARFREFHKKHLKQTVDLEKLQPFGGGDATRSCLLMEHRPMRVFDNSGTLRLEAQLRNQRDRPKQTDSLRQASNKFDFVEAPEPLPRIQSPYLSMSNSSIKEGATLLPHVLALIDHIEGPDHQDMVKITTRRSSKLRWKEVPPQTGTIPDWWVRTILNSSNMLPYIPTITAPRGIIPTGRNGNLLKEPGLTCHFWSELDEIYEQRAGIGSNTPKNLLGRFNFRSGLSVQLSESGVGKWKVLYPSSGDIMRAARIIREQGIVDSTLFWVAVQSKEEAGYLTALLNAACLQRAFRECRDSGRDFQLHPWRRVPIPLYKRTNSRHYRLSELCVHAESIAKQIVEDTRLSKPNLGQVRLSNAIRQGLEMTETGKEIEDIVIDLMPAHADRQ